jgi:hypothetical protein
MIILIFNQTKVRQRRLILADKNRVIKFVNLMTGYFRTPKTLTFYILIDKLNPRGGIMYPQSGYIILNLFKAPRCPPGQG